jgi:hypothetical protein
MCAGWMRFRASLVAMRRTSWIDQRINDGEIVVTGLSPHEIMPPASDLSSL